MELTEEQIDALMELLEILQELKEKAGKKPEVPENVEPEGHPALKNPAAFYDEIRQMFEGKRISQKQVDGIETKLAVMIDSGNTVSHAAYKLATSFHETAQTMQPVREAYWLTENWRKKNLRYYPWYGRGDVQLTWERNYRRADAELGLQGTLITNPERALETEISAKVLDKGISEGWFGPQPLLTYLPHAYGTFEEFRQARRTVNIMDKASLIAGYAEAIQKALIKGGWKG